MEREPLGHDNKEGTSTAMEEEGGKAAAGQQSLLLAGDGAREDNEIRGARLWLEGERNQR